ncbi:ATP-binding protein [Microbispora sp. ZYX-F-249]|uniref:Oxygen sensor histidine kinase NreB n=1 Tax=Microbispora maris TaxID=3144104 RepID=A0ABV0AY80_9ACTN
MVTRLSRPAAGGLLGASAVLFAATAWGAAFVTGVTAPAASDIVWFAGFLAFPLVGALIAWHRPGNPVGWFFLAVGVLQFGAAVVDGLAQHAVATDPASVLGPLLVLVQNALFAVAWVTATTYPLLLYPDGRPPTPRWRWALHATTAALVVLIASIAVTPGRISEDDPAVNPLGVPRLGPVAPAVTTGMLVVLLGLTLTATASIIVRWSRADGAGRERLAWLALAAVVVIAGIVAQPLTDAWTPDWFGAILESLTVAAMPVATGVAILRTDLFDIAAVLDRAIVYAALTAIVVVTYLACLAVTSTILAPDPSRGSALLATAVVAVSLSPVKERLLRGVDRLLFGDRGHPYEVLTGLAERLSRIDVLEELLRTVTETLTTMLRLPQARVVTGRDVPAPPGMLAFPLVAHGRQEGTLLVGRRSGQSRFDAREQELLADLAGQIAVAIRAARLSEDLRESRERIVRAREEERLRVRRDLHDGLGPLLAAASLQIDVLADRVGDADTAHLVAKIKALISRSVTDVRQVVHGLRPPALDDLGLAGVVREHAAALRAAGLRVEVRCPGDLAVPSAAVEVAAYRIVTEAMTNVVRHAGAASCTVTLMPEDPWLRVEVADDGIGVASPHRDGVGLASMRERADELGGTLTIGPGPGGGTRVTALLPLHGSGRI